MSIRYGAALSLLALLVAPALIGVCAEPQAERARYDPPRYPPRLKRSESFLGMHFDFHAGPDCQEVGKRTTRESIDVSRDQYAASLHQSTQAFTQQMQTTMMAFVDRVDAWQNAMQATTLSSAGQAEELHRLGRTLLQMTESEERLIQLQEQLNKNLQTLEVVATLEQTVNSLNAAVNVLTAKTALRVAA